MPTARDWETRVAARIDRDELVELTRQAVRFATVNPPGQAPLDFDDKGSSNGLGLDYVSVAIGPHGTPWASFWDACGEDLPRSHPGCPASRHSGTAKVFGFMDYAGRLAVRRSHRHKHTRGRRWRRKHHRRCNDCDGGSVS